MAIECNSLLWGGMLNPVIVMDDALKSDPLRLQRFLNAHRPDTFMVAGDAAAPLKEHYDDVHFHGLTPFHTQCVRGEPYEGISIFRYCVARRERCERCLEILVHGLHTPRQASH